MEIQCKKKDKILIVTIKGEIDHHTCETLRTQVDSTLERMGGKHIVFHMKGVTFMDSSGIGVIIGRYKLVQRLGGHICIVASSGAVEQILQFSAISKLIPSVETTKEAIDLLEGGYMRGI
ncbi:MAG: anti-sigma factor antagonist [Bacillota bacterium]